MNRFSLVVILVLAFAGLADSFYLAEHEISGTPLICDIQNLTGCNIVANSGYSHLFGIPAAYFGVALYGGLFILAALEIVLYDRVVRRMLQAVASLIFLFSLVSTGIQLFLIKALCIYCLGSGFIALLIFIFVWFIEPVRRRRTPLAPLAPARGTTAETLPMPPV
ncbi:vitamin K epoxide reductase family protein [Patescibacteria group bacterium]|nr:vitamin K epoxide reductase family protein [Patescibacteria group bacterium]